MTSVAMKLSRIDFREVSAQEYIGVREPRPLLYCKLILVLCFDVFREGLIDIQTTADMDL